MHQHCQPGRMENPERCWKFLGFLQLVWRGFVPSTRNAATSRIRVLLLLEKMICKTRKRKGEGAEKLFAGKEMFAQQHKIKTYAWSLRKVSMGTAPLFGIQDNFCLCVIWKENTRANTWKRRIKQWKLTLPNQWVNPKDYFMIRCTLSF